MALFGGKKNEEQQQSSEQSKKDMDALLDAFSAKFDEKLKPLSETVTTLKSKFDAIETAAANETTEEQRRAAAAAEGELTAEQKLEKQNRALLQLNIQTNARITEKECIDSVKEQWPELVPELQTMFSNTPVDVKANPKYGDMCMRAVDQLVGREARKNGLRKDRNTGKFFIEDGAAGGDGSDNNPLLTGDYDWVNPTNPNQRLSGLDQLKKLGLTAKDYEQMQKNGLVQ
jgi:hypothetical protein